MYRGTRPKGFSLIELLIVIAVIGVLLIASLVALREAQRSSRDTKRIADLAALQSALELCRVEGCGDNPGEYPNPDTVGSWAGLAAALADYSVGTVPNDPDQGPERYYVYGTNENLDAYILGVRLEKSDHTVLLNDNDDIYFNYHDGVTEQLDTSDWRGLETLESVTPAAALSIGRDHALNPSILCTDTNNYYCITN